MIIEYTDEDGKTIEVKSEVLEYLHEVVTPEPAPAKKKCGKKSAELVVSIISASTACAIILKKRK